MSDKKHAKVGITSDRLAHDAMRFLREKYPHKTADRVSFDTGFSVNTVSKWLCGAALPNGPAMVRLLDVYEAEFLTVILPEREWAARAALDAEHLRLADARAAIDARIQELRA